jgi:hypothetical protein
MDINNEIKEIYETTLKGGGFEGSIETGFTRKVKKVVSTMIVNGVKQNQYAEMTLTVKYIGEGSIEGTPEEIIYGTNITVNNSDGDDWWFNKEDLQLFLSKNFGNTNEK